MDFLKWQENQKRDKQVSEAFHPLNDFFFGRKNELYELKRFIIDNEKKLFCLCGVPMMGKTSLITEFCKFLPNEQYKILTIKLINPENPETVIINLLKSYDWSVHFIHLIIIENFEEALLWKGNQEHLHEINYPEIRNLIASISKLSNVKVILESRFQIKTDFLPKSILSELSSKELGKIDRKELYTALNEIYRHNSVQYDVFEEVCEKLNDHVWLIELAMQNDWLFEDVREASQHPESLTQKLWDHVQMIVSRLPSSHKMLLCAFGLNNPISEEDMRLHIGTLKIFSQKDELNNALLSLRKKLLLKYDTSLKSYEVNPYLREICFTYLKEQPEMKSLEKVQFFANAKRPFYESIMQAHDKGDYTTFFKEIKYKRKKREFQEVIDILKQAYWSDPKKEVILNEIGVTYKWQKKYEDAITYFKQACELGNVHSFTELGIVYKELKQYNEAIKYLIVGCEKNNIHSFTELAIVYKIQHNYSEAIKVLEKALKIDSNDTKILNELAIVLRENKEYERAIKIFQIILSLNKKNTIALNGLSIIYRELKNYNEAIRLLKKSIIINDTDPHAYTELGRVYKEMGDYENAINILNETLLVNGKDIIARNELATIYLEKKDFKKAFQTIEVSLKIDPSNYFSNNLKRKIMDKEKYAVAKPIRNMAQKKILFISANPADQSRIQTDSEYRIIKAEIKRGTHRDSFIFLQPQISVTITELLRALNEKPNIIHFSGHGTSDGIIITTDNNISLPLPLAAMDRLFKPLKDILQIVILNSCYSAEQARSISQYGIYVVGNNLPIGDNAAIAFSKGLYNGLSEGKEFEAAYNDAIAVVLIESPKYAEVIEVWKDGINLAI